MFSQNNNKRVNIDDKNAVPRLKNIITEQILSLEYHINKKIIILCIGTDRSTGDCLGPLTGTYLQKKDYLAARVLGNLEYPVHANNLDQKIGKINSKYINPFIIAIDAGLGRQSSVGCIDVKKGPLHPGSGVNKQLTSVGNMHITGLVNVSGYMEYLVLQSTRLSLVIKMAEIIANSLKISINSLKKQRKKIR